MGEGGKGMGKGGEVWARVGKEWGRVGKCKPLLTSLVAVSVLSACCLVLHYM